MNNGATPEKNGNEMPPRPTCGGERRIRTSEGVANRFTVCPLWPLGYLPIPNEKRNEEKWWAMAFPPESGAGERNRTSDLLITNQPLCRLSYASYSRRISRQPEKQPFNIIPFSSLLKSNFTVKKPIHGIIIAKKSTFHARFSFLLSIFLFLCLNTSKITIPAATPAFKHDM